MSFRFHLRTQLFGRHTGVVSTTLLRRSGARSTRNKAGFRRRRSSRLLLGRRRVRVFGCVLGGLAVEFFCSARTALVYLFLHARRRPVRDRKGTQCVAAATPFILRLLGSLDPTHFILPPQVRRMVYLEAILSPSCVSSKSRRDCSGVLASRACRRSAGGK